MQLRPNKVGSGAMVLASVAVAACALLPGASPTTVPPTPAASWSSAPSPQPSALTGVLPADLYRLGDVWPAGVDEAASAISASAALQAAAGEGYDWPGAQPYLVIVTDRPSSASNEPIINRLVWLLRWADISVQFPVPVPREGTPEPPKPYHYAYVLVDAQSSKVLVAVYMD